jgi:lysine 2,3-aminomutase
METIEQEQNEVSVKETWKKLVSSSITTAEQLSKSCKHPLNLEELNEVIQKFPMSINPYYLSLIESVDDPIWKQCIPDIKELHDDVGIEDPLHEEVDMPVPGLTHRYPDRVLFLISNQCAMYCRFCTRKRKVGDPHKPITKTQIMKGIEYIREHKEVRDVLISGGDPLMMPDSFIDWVLGEVRSIPHVEMIRIGTRTPCTLPQRITPELCAMLKKYHPLFVNTHFNHPNEVTQESKAACEMLADAGIPLGNQTVLMKGINDDPSVMKELVHKLLMMRVKPYYLYQADLVQGTNHFRTPVQAGLDIIDSLRGHTSGLAVPHYIIDTPGGGGKIPLIPNYVESKDGKKIILRNYEDKRFEYPDID